MCESSASGRDKSSGSAKLILADQVDTGDTILIAVKDGTLVAEKK